MSADDAMRWLESLAAQQGAAPEELVTTPEERTTTPPEWVMAKAPAPAVEEPLAEPLVLSSAPSTPEAAAYQATEPDFSTMSADEAMRWLEGLAAQQGAAPEELVTAPEERTTTPPEWVAAQTAEPVIEAPSTPEIAAPSAIEPDFSSMSADDAMRWLEGLAAQQGAAPEELVTAPEERTTTPPEWVVAQTAEPVAETPALAESVTEAPVSFEAPPLPEVAAPSAAEPDFGSMSPDEAMRWLEGLAAQQGAAPEVVSAPAVQPEPTSVPPPTEQPSQITRLSRLAEKLATSRQAREAEIESRFAEERARKEAARLAVQERMEKRKIDTGPLAPRPGTGPLRQPIEASATPSEEVTPTPEAAPPSRPSIGTESTKPKVRPPSKPAPRTRKSLAKSPHAGEAPDNILAHSQQRMLDGDFETAAEGLSYLVSSGQMVDDVIERLEDFAPHQPGAASLLRVLGDAYMRNNQLQKALDVYRQALGQL
jgi:hypothetical protein